MVAPVIVVEHDDESAGLCGFRHSTERGAGVGHPLQRACGSYHVEAPEGTPSNGVVLLERQSGNVAVIAPCDRE